MWNGKFCFFTSDGVERSGHYREPSLVDNGEHWYYCNPSNYVLEKGAVITISVPIKRILPDGSTQDLTGKSLLASGTYRLYFSYTKTAASDNLLHDSALQIVDPTSLSDVVIADGKIFDLSITATLMNNVSYYLEDDFDYDDSKAYFSHERRNGEVILIPMRLSEWA